MLYTILKECESYQRMQVVEANSVNCDIRSSGGHGKLTMARCQIVFTQSKTFWRKFYVVCRVHIIFDRYFYCCLANSFVFFDFEFFDVHM